jgi:glycosyltransferase involved in cell wall biosynthesis
MRVLQFVHTYGEKNGISLHVRNLAAAMPESVRVQVIAGSGDGLPLFSSLRFPVAELWQALRADFDVIHVHGYGNFYSFFGAAVSWLRGKPLVWTIHGYPRIGGARRLMYCVYRHLMAPFVFWRAARIISVSGDVAPMLRRETRKQILVLPNGVDLSLFRPKAGYRKAKCACFVGRLDPDKGAERLLECGSMPLLFIGPDEGGERQRLERKAEELGRKAEFVEVPYEKMPREYGKCRYVALPSKYEGFPLTLLEAVAMERPFISTDVGQVKEVMGKLGLDTGLFILRGNVGGKLTELEKHDLSGQMKKARARLKQYSWQSVAAKLAAVYRQPSPPSAADASNPPAG